MTVAPLPVVAPVAVAPASPRLVSLDAFRGMTIAAMILVNNPGDWGHVYAPLRHADWHGWTPTDLVFPFFLFIVGVAIVLSVGRRAAAGAARGALVANTLRRATILFALGLFIHGWPFVRFSPEFGWRPELWSIRIPGVLQRIAVCYLLAALLVIAAPRARLWPVIVALLVGYHAVMTLVPVPGIGAPDLDAKDRNLAAWLDRALLDGHLWRNSRTWDPEGILSTLPALATCLFGVATGRLVADEPDPTRRTARLLVRGATLVAAGYVWGWFFPINKQLWTSSYAVFTAGQAMAALGVCHWLCDVRGRTAWAGPYVVYGVNAITVFVGSALLARTLALIVVAHDGERTVNAQQWLHRTLLASWLPPHAASLGYALLWVAGWYVVLRAMHARGWILKV